MAALKTVIPAYLSPNFALPMDDREAIYLYYVRVNGEHTNVL